MAAADLLIQLLHHQWLLDSCVFATVVDDELHSCVPGECEEVDVDKKNNTNRQAVSITLH